MITNFLYKNYALQIAKQFCKEDQLCTESVRQRILNYFTNNTFEHFLQHIQQGRWYSLKYSNWRQSNNCRNILIDVRLMDVITGNVINGYWYYTAENCEAKQYYYPDLNSLIGVQGYTLLDAPIMNKTNAEVGKERLVWASGGSNYGITFVPSQAGNGGGEIITTPEKQSEPILNTPVTKEAGFNLESLTSNPLLLYGGIAVLFFFLMKK